MLSQHVSSRESINQFRLWDSNISPTETSSGESSRSLSFLPTEQPALNSTHQTGSLGPQRGHVSSTPSLRSSDLSSPNHAFSMVPVESQKNTSTHPKKNVSDFSRKVSSIWPWSLIPCRGRRPTDHGLKPLKSVSKNKALCYLSWLAQVVCLFVVLESWLTHKSIQISRHELGNAIGYYFWWSRPTLPQGFQVQVTLDLRFSVVSVSSFFFLRQSNFLPEQWFFQSYQSKRLCRLHGYFENFLEKSFFFSAKEMSTYKE